MSELLINYYCFQRSLLGGVHHPSHQEDAAGHLMVNEEEEGSIDGEARRRAGQHIHSSAWGAACFVRGDGYLMHNLKTKMLAR